MYNGEVKLETAGDLEGFLRAGELLEIEGLTNNNCRPVGGQKYFVVWTTHVPNICKVFVIFYIYRTMLVPPKLRHHNHHHHPSKRRRRRLLWCLKGVVVAGRLDHLQGSALSLKRHHHHPQLQLFLSALLVRRRELAFRNLRRLRWVQNRQDPRLVLKKSSGLP
jgi:hypothetical protein